MTPNPTFMELVQLHERKWGETQYPGRPSLDELLNGYIVVMWSIDKRFIFTIHQNAGEVNTLVFGLITGNVHDPLNRKLARIFVNREPIDFRIKIITVPLIHQQSA